MARRKRHSHFWQRAHRSQVARGQIRPPRDHGRQGGADLISAKLQQELA